MTDQPNSLLKRLDDATTALRDLCAIAPRNWDDPEDSDQADAWLRARDVLISEGYPDPLRLGESEPTHFAGEFLNPANEG